MASPKEESSAPEGRDIAIRKMATGGRESAAKLKVLIGEALAGSRALDSTAGDLIEQVLGSLSGVLSELESGEASEIGPESVILHADSPGDSINRETENPTRKRKIPPAARDRRGGCRRSRGNPYSWKRVTSATIDDGHTWRKYGQKDIFSSKYPRSYFRCTHKYDRGCQASRQVQRSEEDSSMFLITYIGEHTCKDTIKNSQIPTTSNSIASCVINFGSNTTEEGQELPFGSSFASFKQECDEEVLSSLTPRSSLSEYFVPPELPTTLEEFIPMMQQIADAAPDHADAASLQSSSSSLGTAFMNEVFDFGGEFSFPQDEPFDFQNFPF